MSLKEIVGYIEDRKDWLAGTTASFIATPSLSGSEGAASELLARTLQTAIGNAFIDEAGNVVASLREDGPAGKIGTTLAFNVHLDTVPAGDFSSWKHAPFGGVIEDGKVYGRGASDTKGAWAPMILAMEAVKRLGVDLDGEVLFTAVVMEELTGSLGMRHLLDRTLRETRPDLIILGEPTGLRLAIGHKGRAEVEVVTRGTSCHASTPRAGRNALYQAAAAVSRLEELSGEMEQGPEDPLFGRSTMAVTHIESAPGAHNMIPDLCTIFVDCRFAPSETTGGVLKQIDAALRSGGVAAEVRFGEKEERTCTGISLRAKKYMAPWTLDEKDPFVVASAEAATAALGKRPDIYRWDFATDGSYSMGVLGIPTLGFSPCEDRLAHVTDEYVDIESMVTAAKVYAALIIALTGKM